MQTSQGQRLLSFLRRADEKYGMIQENDRVAVGLSGGKDSICLLWALAEYRRFSVHGFTLCAITVDAGFKGTDHAPLEALCRELQVPFYVVKTDIYEIVFEKRKEKNPCALCAGMRRAALLDKAEELGCGKLALGHHADDAAVTFLMNLFNEGRVGCFSPVTVFEDRPVTLIRPLILAREKDLSYFVRKNALPVIGSRCPADKHTDREEYARLLRDLEKRNKGVVHRVCTALEKAEIDGFKR